MREKATTVGRPRDPQLTERALRAALEIYGERGWPAFSLNEVARRSSLAKATLYARWGSRQELLTDAFRLVIPAMSLPEGNDFQEIRQHLIDHASLRAEAYLGYSGNALYRLLLDARVYPEVFTPILDEALRPSLRAEQHAIKKAIDEGHLPPTTSRVHLLDSIEGSVMFHVLITPDALMASVRRQLPEYIERLVDIQLGTDPSAETPPENS